MRSTLLRLLLLIFSACLLPAYGQGQCAAAQPQIRLLGTNVAVLGKVPGYKVKQVSFVFTNTSQTRVRIVSLMPTCSCVRGQADKEAVPPGGTATVNVHFTPSQAQGVFERGLWVNFSGGDQQRVYLAVAGEVVPLFSGVPSDPVILKSRDLNVVWTNRYTLTPSEAGLRLDPPVVEAQDRLRILASVTTNTVGAGTFSYHVTLVVTPLAFGRHQATVSLPVTRCPQVPPVTLNVSVQVGLSLVAKPDLVRVFETGEPVVRRFLLWTEDLDAAEGQLTWDPVMEGVTVKARRIKSKPAFMVTLELTPEAAKRLRSEKAPRLVFRYPKHEPATVAFVAADNLKNHQKSKE